MDGGSVNKEINAYVKSIKGEYENINLYQEITAKYFTSKFMKKSEMLLLYWDMGSGKTIGSLLCAIRALEEGEKHGYKRIILLSPKSIQEVIDANLKKLCKILFKVSFKASQMYNYYKDRMYMIPYNAWNSNDQLDELGNIDNSIFIIDEVHLFIKSVIKTNLTKADLKAKSLQNKGNAKRMYDRIRKLKNKKILCLSGTPLAKFTFEMVPLFNLSYRDKDIFEENYVEFQNKYYDAKAEKLRVGAEEKILSKIDGRVSYVPPIDTGVKVSPLKEVLVEMSVGQFKQYVYDYALELQENAYSNSINMFGVPFGSIGTYHTKTFQDCLYWNSELDVSDFRQVVLESKDAIKGGASDVPKRGVVDALKRGDNDSDSDSDDDDGYEPPYDAIVKPSYHHTMSDYFEDKFDYDFDGGAHDDELIGGARDDELFGGAARDDDSDDYYERDSEERHKIKHFLIDKTHCPKIIRMYEDSLKFDGIKCFYFRLTRTYGCDTMEKLLQKEGYTLADPKTCFASKGKRYVLFTGNISQDRRNEYMNLVNSVKNTTGEYIQYIILSPSGQVGISLRNVRFLGIGTAEFSYSSLLQIQTRCVRFRSHDGLPPNERTLEQRIYFSSPNKSFLKKYYSKLSVLLSRTDPLIKNEKHPTIERIIYYNSIHDDIPMQAFRKLLYKASITEKLFAFKSR